MSFGDDRKDRSGGAHDDASEKRNKVLNVIEVDKFALKEIEEG